MYTLVEFILDLKTDIETVLSSKMKVTIREQDIHMFGRESYLGLVIIPEKQRTGVVLNISDLYKRVLDGTPYEVIVGESMKEIDQQFRKNINNYFSLFVDYEQIRNRLVMQVVSTEKNKEKLKLVPYMEKGDKSIIYRVIVSEEAERISSFVITNELLKTYHVRKEELHVDAVNCAFERNNVQLGRNSVLDMLQKNQERIKKEESERTREDISRRRDLWKN